MHAYTHIHTTTHTLCMHTHMHPCTHTYIHTYTLTYSHAYTLTCIHRHACMYSYTCICMHTHSDMHTHIHTASPSAKSKLPLGPQTHVFLLLCHLVHPLEFVFILVWCILVIFCAEEETGVCSESLGIIPFFSR